MHQTRAQRINAALALAYPDAHCALVYSNPLELAVATILSAQCTDARVNAVTPALFTAFPDATAYASASEEEIRPYIASLGFQKRKAAQLVRLGQSLLTQHGGEIPSTMEELTALPGIGRKTANVIRGNAFGLPGLSVDTHFARLVRRWELTSEQKPEKIEADIAAQLPESEWTMFSHRTITHGREVCTARKPHCGRCPLTSLCPAVNLDDYA